MKGQYGKRRCLPQSPELDNLNCIVDYNNIALDGPIEQVMHWPLLMKNSKHWLVGQRDSGHNLQN